MISRACGNPVTIWCFVFLNVIGLKGLVCGLTSQSTAMVMWRQSVNFFWGKLRPCI